MFLMSADVLKLIMLAICVVPIAILIVVALIIRIRNAVKKKAKYNEDLADVKPDLEMRLEFMKAYGGEENVSEVKLQGSKLCIVVKDSTLVKGEDIQNLGANGVLIIGNEIRCSFSDRTEQIYNLMK